MAEYKVLLSGMQENAVSFENCMKKLNHYSDRVDSIRSRLSLSGNSAALLKRDLRRIADGIEEEGKVCKKMSGRVRWAAEIYEKTETAIIQGPKDIWDKALDFTAKVVIAGIGPFGYMVNIVNGKKQGKTDEFINGILKLVSGVVKNLEGSKINWKKLFNLPKGSSTPWKDAVGKYFDFSSVKKGFSSACNWATAIITSGFDNYREHKEFSERFFEETIVETLLGVGKGILVSGLVGAIMGATAPGWVTAAVVAGVTVAADAGLNALTEHLTNGEYTKWTEKLSDMFCDGYEAVRDLKEEGKNVLKNVGGAICNWGKGVVLGGAF